VNASIRLSFALFVLLLAGCAASGQRVPDAPRAYRETLLFSEAPPRSAEVTLSVPRSHERARRLQ
jgi:hypothetical protein